jgi:hypothetical protein
VEETLRQVAAMPDYVLDNQELLEGFTLEAFEQAAASYLPPILSDAVYRQRPDLQEGRSIGGTAWVGMPFRSRKWCYLKCPRTFTVRITPQMAETIETFEGNNLANFFYEQMGLPAGEAVEAEVHLYEATHNTSLADLTRHETQVPGLGSSDETAMVQLHPLTPEVAGLLLDDPSLGRELPARTLSNRRAIGRGQRVYHLALRGARPLMVPGMGRSKVRRHSGVKKVQLNFPADQIKVHFFLSEIRAQQLAVSLRKQAHPGTIITSIKRILERGLLPTLSGLRPGRIQILHGALMPDQALGGVLQKLPGFVTNAFARTLKGWLLESLAENLRGQAQKFISATEDTADGITVVFTLANPPGFGGLREILKGKMPAPSNLGFGSGKPKVSVEVFPGFKND